MKKSHERSPTNYWSFLFLQSEIYEVARFETVKCLTVGFCWLFGRDAGWKNMTRGVPK